jgi:uncharacterized RDD family membrane protein YckC
MNWYYAEAGAQKGPVTDDQFRALQDEGTITADTLVWKDGMASWQPLSAVTGAQSATPANAKCAECAREFPTGDMIAYGATWVCAECKPLFFQKVKEGTAAVSGLMYAGFWIRCLAKIIDGFIIGVVNMIPSFGLGFLTAMTKPDPNAPGSFVALQVLVFVIQLAIGVGYSTWFVGKHAATPGKMACGLKIVTAEGGRVSYGRACGRYFAEMLSALILYIGYIMAGFDNEKRALHDRICNTRVVRK